eukprot:207457-Prymnesium_polylepis.1
MHANEHPGGAHDHEVPCVMPVPQSHLRACPDTEACRRRSARGAHSKAKPSAKSATNMRPRQQTPVSSISPLHGCSAPIPAPLASLASPPMTSAECANARRPRNMQRCDSP